LRNANSNLRTAGGQKARPAPLAASCKLFAVRRSCLLAVICSLFAASGVPATAGTLEAFIAEARAAHPDEPILSWTVRTLGSSEAMFERLLPLILSGEKTGTFSLGEAPQVGEYCVVTHFDGTPALIWRVTAVEIVPFDAISLVHVQVEGKALRDVERWREVHIAAWSAQLQGKSRAEIGATPVVAQRYVVIHPQAAADRDAAAHAYHSNARLTARLRPGRE
jgi:uncharacterized protein YhfF